MRPSKRLLGILALLVAAVMIVPAISFTHALNEMGEERSEVRVYFNDLDGQNDLKRLKVREFYDSFAIAKLSGKEKRLLESKGYAVYEEPFLHTIAMNGFIFDTRDGQPKISEKLRIDSYPGGVAGHYLVQFEGPIKEEWKNKVTSLGVELGDYIPYNSFIVKMNSHEMGRVSQLDFVQWIGIYQPAYKIRPELMDGKGSYEVEIITYEGSAVNTVLARLDTDQVMSHYSGEDFGLVKAEIDRKSLIELAGMDGVRYIEPYYEPVLTNEYMQWIHQTNIQDNRKMWDKGLDGTGQIIAYSDTGLDYDHRFFRQDAGTIVSGDIYNVTDMNRRKVIRYMTMSNWTDVDPWTDEWAVKDSGPRMGWATSGHGTMVAGTGAGRDDDSGGTSLNDGLAKGAKIYMQDIGTVCQPEPGAAMDDCLRYIPDDYHFLFWYPYSEGVRIHSNSWGTHDSAYDLEAMMVDKFMWDYPDMHVIFSNGNGGPSSGDRYDVGSPASAKSIVSAGAGGNARTLTGWDEEDVAGYSSLGPTADGRLKPTVVMVGEGRSSRSDANPWSNANPGDVGWLGTSYAAPAASGAAAIVRQYFVDGWYPTGDPVAANGINPSAALVKAILAASGSRMTGSYRDYRNEQKWPNNSQGWGRPILDDVLYFSADSESRKLSVVEHKEGLITGNDVSYHYFVNSGEELKVQLVWSDYPGSVGATTALVNDLNLEVTSPTGFVYKGNVFSTPFGTSESRPGGLFDAKNPIEGVRLSSPSVGVWTVKVTGANIPSGPQPFALVVSGNIEQGFGQVFIDKEVYSDYDTINIEVVDTDAVSVSVKVTSTTEPSGEVVTLDPVGGSPNGVFRGSINTQFQASSTNGTLEVSHQDTIVVTYNDISPVRTSTADAIVDAAGPVITDVFVKDITNAAATITWVTDEPSDSRVYWGDTTALGSVNYDPTLNTYHEVDLIGLETGAKYYFDAESSDWFGHTTIDTNGGVHYTFTTTEKSEILLVIGDSTFPPERVQYYRNALEWGGWTYNLWFIDRSGDPSLSLLQEYKAVLWQTGLEQYPPIEDSQRPIIGDYIDGGGRFFLSSHDTAWAFSTSSNSQFSSPERFGFLRSKLKADWKEDPYTWSHVEGEIGDPISGSYTSSNRIPYTYHRRGGSGDEVQILSAGGTSLSIWRSYGLEANGDTSGLRWVSSVANDSVPGDDPDIVWDGYPSKIAVFFFEFTGLDFGTTSSGIRGDVLNKTIIWLLDNHYHPVVDLTYPNGGETFSGNSITIHWNRTASPAVAQQAVYYSDDADQTWTLIDGAVAAGQTSYAWDISSVANGNRYMVKVVVQDSDTPPLNGTDSSDSVFTITKPGGDQIGPITIPGSVISSPNPVTKIQSVQFSAIIDDTDKGNSNIYGAEYFVQPTEPLPGDYGTGAAMGATDGGFDSPQEQVEWQGPVTGSAWEAAGNYTLWVHGRDDPDGVPSSGDENWGSFYWVDFTVIYPPPDISVEPPTFVSAELIGGTFQNVRIVWGLSPDDPAVGGAADVIRYEVFRGTAYDATGLSYVYLGQANDGQSSFTATSDGHGDANTYFYTVVAVDSMLNRGISTEQAGKFATYLQAGVNLVSTPLVPYDPSPAILLQTLDFDKAWTYDAFDVTNGWKNYDKDKPYGGDFTSTDQRMGIWVNVNTAGYMTVAGTVPTITSISLNIGWTLVGYPSFTNRTIQQALTGIGYDRIEGFDPAQSPYHLIALAPTDPMAAGEAFWIHVISGATWVVNQ